MYTLIRPIVRHCILYNNPLYSSRTSRTIAVSGVNLYKNTKTMTHTSFSNKQITTPNTTNPTIQQILTHHALPGPTVLSQGKLNRFNLYRKNADILGVLNNNQHVLYLCHFELKPLVQKLSSTEYKPVYLTAQQLQQYNISFADYNQVLLGIDEHYTETQYTLDTTKQLKPLYAINISDKQLADQIKSHDSTYEYNDVRTLLPLTSTSDSALLGMARTLIEWHTLNQYCGKCGTATTSIEGGCKRKCTNSKCNRTVYPRVDPVIIVLTISHDGHTVLLGRKHSFPAGMHTCIAGFMEPGESIEEAAVREIYEETNVIVQPHNVRYVANQPWPFLGGQLMIGLFAVADPPSTENNQQQPKLLDGELQHAAWYTREQCLDGLALSNDPNVWQNAVKQYDSNIPVEQDGAKFKVPGKIAVAHDLINAWANNVFQNNK